MNSRQKFSKRKSAVLFVLPWDIDSIGGVSQVVTNLYLESIRRNEIAPLILINDWLCSNYKENNDLVWHKIFFRIRTPWCNGNKLKGLVAFFVFLPHSILILKRLLSIHNVQAVNVHFPGLSALQFCILKLFGLFKGKIILSFHGSDIRNARTTKGVEKSLWKMLLKFTNVVVVCSEYLKQEVVEFSPQCAKKTYTIHNGIDIDFLLNERDKDFKLDLVLQSKQFILNIGTFEFQKGQDVLIKAFASVASRFRHLDLVLVGRPAGELDELKALISSLQLQNKAFLYEGIHHDKIATFLENASIFCLPSRMESFPIVLLEASVFSIPVVASKVGGIPEIISHNVTGRLFQSEDVDALADEISMLLENPEERERLGTNLRAQVLANFTWQNAYQEYLQLF